MIGHMRSLFYFYVKSCAGLIVHACFLSRHSCQYLAERYCPDADDETVLRNHAVCLCDDDNDVEMASACRHAYIPAITSDHMATTIAKDPDHFSLTDRAKTHGTASSEAALSLILAKLAEEEEVKMKS